jgi:hypothetical protein
MNIEMIIVVIIIELTLYRRFKMSKNIEREIAKDLIKFMADEKPVQTEMLFGSYTPENAVVLDRGCYHNMAKPACE